MVSRVICEVVDDSETHSKELLFCRKELTDGDFQALEDLLHSRTMCDIQKITSNVSVTQYKRMITLAEVWLSFERCTDLTRRRQTVSISYITEEMSKSSSRPWPKSTQQNSLFSKVFMCFRVRLCYLILWTHLCRLIGPSMQPCCFVIEYHIHNNELPTEKSITTLPMNRV